MHKSYHWLVSLLLLFWYWQRQQVRLPKGLTGNAHSRLSLTYSQPLAVDAPEKSTNHREAILVSLQECWNLPVSWCTGTLIAKGKVGFACCLRLLCDHHLHLWQGSCQCRNYSHHHRHEIRNINPNLLTPTNYSQSIDHSCVGVCANNTVRIQNIVHVEHNTAKILQVNLMNYAGARWDNCHIFESFWAPLQKK